MIFELLVPEDEDHAATYMKAQDVQKTAGGNGFFLFHQGYLSFHADHLPSWAAVTPGGYRPGMMTLERFTSGHVVGVRTGQKPDGKPTAYADLQVIQSVYQSNAFTKQL